MIGKHQIVNAGGYQPPTLDELRAQHEKEQAGRSRFHKSICPHCGALITNQAMGRAAHIRMHKRLAIATKHSRMGEVKP